ncbi:hypothetical protein [Cohnella sp. REN36]|uniref:hypothetical protein n=1 Tax=Cohnella sp. REN36 TaxID=2887347 RepID=UPI001D138095|nr:hypothetical protein [Cohnella sp. REN36]MCC3375452.1 hypothetical protein [Cohnella sp. REN36]
MKSYLILTQLFYAICLIPWLLVGVLSFMSFDQGFSAGNVAFVVGIWMYPVAAIASAMLSWMFRKRRPKLAVGLNLIPLIWVLGLGIPLAFLNFS